MRPDSDIGSFSRSSCDSIHNRKVCNHSCRILDLRMDETHVEVSHNQPTPRRNDFIDCSSIAIYLRSAWSIMMAGDFDVLDIGRGGIFDHKTCSHGYSQIVLSPSPISDSYTRLQQHCLL